MLKRTASLPIVLLLFGMLASVASVQAADVKDTVKKSFKVRHGGTLYLDIDHGNVVVRSAAGDAVQVEVERSVETDDREQARALFERHDLAIEQSGNNVSVESRLDRDAGRLWQRARGRSEFRVRVIVQVPRRYNVDFSSGAGNVTIGDIEGEVRGQTGAGNITVGAVRGRVEVSSGSGNVQLKGASGHVEASTGAGNIAAHDIRGQVQINTGAGNITAYITEQPRQDSELVSGAGNVTVYLARDVGVDVAAEASVGSASTDFPLKVEGKWMSKSFEGRVNGGGPSLQMRAGVGNVALKKM